LLSFIAALDLRERHQVRLWLKSDLHNTRPELLRLYRLIEEQHLELGLIPQREQLYRALFPENGYDDQHFRLLCSYLHQSLEEWLQWREWKRSTTDDTALLTAYRNRGLSKHFRRREKSNALNSTNSLCATTPITCNSITWKKNSTYNNRGKAGGSP
jgi:hypothetical protein